MIKVIASDMDGTLLGDDHRIAPETLAAVKRACDAGIRFMVATGRNFPGAMEELKGTERRGSPQSAAGGCKEHTDLHRFV